MSIHRQKLSTPDRRVRCLRRSTSSTSFSPACDRTQRQDDAANRPPEIPVMGELARSVLMKRNYTSMSAAAFLLMTLAATAASAQRESTSGYAPVNGVNMYYEVHGSGEPVVLLHGAFMTITNNWGGWIEELSKTRKVIAIEMQGHGRTADVARDITYENLADDVAGLLDYLKIPRADLIGYSMAEQWRWSVRSDTLTKCGRQSSFRQRSAVTAWLRKRSRPSGISRRTISKARPSRPSTGS